MVVSTATSESSVMSLTSGTNKWASRIVIILQLAAWSAVGVILLQRGVISLQYGPPKPKNVTQIIRPTESTTIFETSQSFESEANENQIQQERKSKAPRRIVKSTDAVRRIEMNPQGNGRITTEAVSIEESEEVSFAEFIESRRRGRKNARTNITLHPPACKNGGKKSNKHPPKRKISKITQSKEDNEESRENDGASNSTASNNNDVIKCVNDTLETLPKISPTNEYDVENESRDSTIAQTLVTENSRDSVEGRGGKRLRLSRLSGGGAAAAIAMVAVGAVMLVLGPAVIILRALDERRQQRRFLKLSTRDDLPPSYEQATLMDEAPRYSTLSLNMVLAQDQPSTSSSSFMTPSTSTKHNNAMQSA